MHSNPKPSISGFNRHLCVGPGRHALTEMAVDSFVPNDTLMHRSSGRVQVCPGQLYAATGAADTLRPGTSNGCYDHERSRECP